MTHKRCELQLGRFTPWVARDAYLYTRADEAAWGAEAPFIKASRELKRLRGSLVLYGDFSLWDTLTCVYIDIWGVNNSTPLNLQRLIGVESLVGTAPPILRRMIQHRRNTAQGLNTALPWVD